MMQSLDSLRLAEKLERQLESANRTLPVLIEVNVGGEESKNGVQAADETRWDEVEAEIAGWIAFPHLRMRGLMTMPPWSDDPETSRPYFVRLRRLAERLAARFGEEYFCELSMGTSSDFETAVQEGATFVRLGTAIVGPRPPRING
jgi:pyridoxal phosphate enzyme (YggS family)